MNIDLKALPAQEIAAAVHRAFKEYAQDVELMLINGFVYDHARQNDKRTAWLKIAVPDDWVKNYRGQEKLQDLYVAIRVPVEIVQDELKNKDGSNVR